MPIKKETLSPKNIKGKKVRCRSFYTISFFLIIVTASLLYFILAAIIEQLSWETVKILLWIDLPFLLVIILPLAAFNSFKNSAPICIIASDYLYFFNSEIMEFNASNPKRARHSFTNGYIAYSEISDIKYIPPIRKIRSSQLILKGNGFELTLYDVGIGTIHHIKVKQKTPQNINQVPVSDELTKNVVREGIWNEIWMSSQIGKIEKIFDEHTEILQITSDEQCDTLDIAVCRNGCEILFNIDKDTAYMYVPSTDINETVSLNSFTDDKNLYEKMCNFVLKNSKCN